MVDAWRNFKNIFSRPLFTNIFWPKMLKFQPYAILTGKTIVRFVIFCVLRKFFTKTVVQGLLADLPHGLRRTPSIRDRVHRNENFVEINPV